MAPRSDPTRHPTAASTRAAVDLYERLARGEGADLTPEQARAMRPPRLVPNGARKLKPLVGQLRLDGSEVTRDDPGAVEWRPDAD